MLATALAVGSAAVGGTYFAFSAMVMPSLGRLAPQDAARVMRAINARAERGPFILAFGATAVLSVAVAAVALPRLPDPGAAREIGAAALALTGTAVTVLGNVPLNRRLERDGAPYWGSYRRRWTRLNSVRALAHVAGVALATLPA